MTTTKERLDEWQDACPLRVWRRERDFGLHNASSMLAISVSALQTLESGSTTPTDAMLKRLASGMSIKQSTLVSKWSTWLAKKPKR